jgi:hypothetical protein
VDQRCAAARDGLPAGAWASVGASKLDRNQSRIAGEKRSRGSAATVGAGTGRECTADRDFDQMFD